jgi:hypothetical protein
MRDRVQVGLRWLSSFSGVRSHPRHPDPRWARRQKRSSSRMTSRVDITNGGVQPTNAIANSLIAPVKTVTCRIQRSSTNSTKSIFHRCANRRCVPAATTNGSLKRDATSNPRPRMACAAVPRRDRILAVEGAFAKALRSRVAPSLHRALLLLHRTRARSGRDRAYQKLVFAREGAPKSGASDVGTA